MQITKSIPHLQDINYFLELGSIIKNIPNISQIPMASSYQKWKLDKIPLLQILRSRPVGRVGWGCWKY